MGQLCATRILEFATRWRADAVVSVQGPGYSKEYRIAQAGFSLNGVQ